MLRLMEYVYAEFLKRRQSVTSRQHMKHLKQQMREDIVYIWINGPEITGKLKQIISQQYSWRILMKLSLEDTILILNFCISSIILLNRCRHLMEITIQRCAQLWISWKCLSLTIKISMGNLRTLMIMDTINFMSHRQMLLRIVSRVWLRR